MKKTLILLIALGSVSISAQLYTSGGSVLGTTGTSGNVGIGTNNPQSTLNVYHSGSNSAISAMSVDVQSFGNLSNANASHFFRVRDLGSVGNTPFIIKGNGNVGIGHDNPVRKLHLVNGDMYIDGPAVINFGDDARFNVSNTVQPSLATATYSMAQYGIAAPATALSAELWVSGNDGIRFFANNEARMVVLNNGNIGIGTNTPQYKLEVNGKASFSNNVKIDAKLESKEIKVTLTPTADFVFESDYALPKLEDVEKHIKAKKHLPEIASAKEMEKEGVNVGEFQIKLLQKIEELTLYTIEQNKRIKELELKINN